MIVFSVREWAQCSTGFERYNLSHSFWHSTFWDLSEDASYGRFEVCAALRSMKANGRCGSDTEHFDNILMAARWRGWFPKLRYLYSSRLANGQPSI